MPCPRAHVLCAGAVIPNTQRDPGAVADRLSHTWPSSGSITEYTRRLNAVVLYATQHLDGDLSLEILAREACFSPYHFHRIFTSFLGETPADFVKRIRVEKAANLLDLQPSLNITAIALASGFSGPAVFSRSFRDVLGCSPTAWKTRKNRKAIRKNSKAQDSGGKYLSVVKKVQRQPKGGLPMDVAIKELHPLHVAYVANLQGYSEAKIGEAWETLCQWAGARNLLGPNAVLVGMSFDNPDITPADRCRYFACIEVPEGTPTGRDVNSMDICGGKHAVFTFNGRKKDIKEVYRQLYGTWLPSSGYQPADRPSYEIYRTTPGDKPDSVFTMDICVPIEPLQ
jgi:AraC family transcriptional regulator